VPYDINGELIERDEQLVYCVHNGGEWLHVQTDHLNDDGVDLGQCDECGQSEAFVLYRTRDLDRPSHIVCHLERGGCGRRLEVVTRPVGNERNGVVI
jgi:hypothetical protein